MSKIFILITCIVTFVSCVSFNPKSSEKHTLQKEYSDELGRFSFFLDSVWELNPLYSTGKMQFKRDDLNGIHPFGFNESAIISFSIQENLDFGCSYSTKLDTVSNPFFTYCFNIRHTPTYKNDTIINYRWNYTLKAIPKDEKGYYFLFSYVVYLKSAEENHNKEINELLKSLNIKTSDLNGGKNIPYSLIASEMENRKYFKDSLSLDSLLVGNVDFYPEIKGFQKPIKMNKQESPFVDNYELISDCYSNIIRVITFQVVDGRLGHIDFIQRYCPNEEFNPSTLIFSGERSN